jgi:hypothetical protein
VDHLLSKVEQLPKIPWKLRPQSFAGCIQVLFFPFDPFVDVRSNNPKHQVKSYGKAIVLSSSVSVASFIIFEIRRFAIRMVPRPVRFMLFKKKCHDARRPFIRSDELCSSGPPS